MKKRCIVACYYVITYANSDNGEHGDVEIHHGVKHQMEYILIEFILQVASLRDA